MSKFNTQKCIIKCAKNIECTCSMCEYHNTKFEYKGMKHTGVTDYTNQSRTKHFGWKKCLSSTALKIRKYLSNVHKKEAYMLSV